MTPGNKPSIFARINQETRRLGPAGPLALLVTALPGIGGLLLLGVIAAIAPWLREHLVAGLIVYCVGFWILGGLAILPTYANSGLGGWTFGFAIGFPAAMVGLGGAAVIGYLIFLRASGEHVSRLFEQNAKARAVYQTLLKRGFWRALLVVSLIRIPPVPPFAATTVLLAAARVPLSVFIAGTLLGIAPRTAFVAYFFSRAEKLDFHSGGQVWLFAAQLAVTGIVLLILGQLARKAIERITNGQA